MALADIPVPLIPQLDDEYMIARDGLHYSIRVFTRLLQEWENLKPRYIRTRLTEAYRTLRLAVRDYYLNVARIPRPVAVPMLCRKNIDAAFKFKLTDFLDQALVIRQRFEDIDAQRRNLAAHVVINRLNPIVNDLVQAMYILRRPSNNRNPTILF